MSSVFGFRGGRNRSVIKCRTVQHRSTAWINRPEAVPHFGRSWMWYRDACNEPYRPCPKVEARGPMEAGGMVKESRATPAGFSCRLRSYPCMSGQPSGRAAAFARRWCAGLPDYVKSSKAGTPVRRMVFRPIPVPRQRDVVGPVHADDSW